MEQGLVQIYTGEGKEKTTAAFGLALRALCAGKNVAIGQFDKSIKYNETKIETLFNGSNPSFGLLHIEQFGQDCCLDRKPDDADRTSALKVFQYVRNGSVMEIWMWLYSTRSL